MNLTLRRRDRAAPPEEAEKIFESAEYGFLSLVSDDEYPYAVPVSYAIAGKSAYIHCAPEGRKIDMISRNPRASLCAVARAETVPEKFTVRYDSAIAFGRITICSDAGEKRFGLRALAEKYCPGLSSEAGAYIESALSRTAVLRFDFDGISGKRNPVPDNLHRK